MENIGELDAIFHMKVKLLLDGIYISVSLLHSLQEKGYLLSLGRKGGAGPAGGRYFRFPNGSIVNTQIWIYDDKDSEKNPKANLTQQIIITDQKEMQILYKTPFSFQPRLFLIENPEFYSQKSSQGIEFQKLALLHGDHTLASTVIQKCKYWAGGTQCKFCAIENSLASGATTERKSAQDIVEILDYCADTAPALINNVTLTTGTTSLPGKGMEYYMELIPKIRAKYPSLPIHIQIEPPKDLGWYQKLRGVGVNTIGIHLEILDDNIRREICPGKAKITKEIYMEHWKKAVEIFGKGQVDSFILVGFDEDIAQWKHDIDKIVALGVVPFITPARSIPSVDFKVPGISYNSLKDLYLYSAQSCLKFGLDPLIHKAGCVFCGGCSAIGDAYVLESNKINKQNKQTKL